MQNYWWIIFIDKEEEGKRGMGEKLARDIAYYISPDSFAEVKTPGKAMTTGETDFNALYYFFHSTTYTSFLCDSSRLKSNIWRAPQASSHESFTLQKRGKVIQT